MIFCISRIFCKPRCSAPAVFYSANISQEFGILFWETCFFKHCDSEHVLWKMLKLVWKYVRVLVNNLWKILNLKLLLIKKYLRNPTHKFVLSTLIIFFVRTLNHCFCFFPMQNQNIRKRIFNFFSCVITKTY